MTPTLDGTIRNFRTVVAVKRVRVGLAKSATTFQRRRGRSVTTLSYRRNRNPGLRARRLIRELGDGAYERARRGEREATDPRTAAYWHRVALIIANRTAGKVD
jgi:hypothetical protein